MTSFQARNVKAGSLIGGRLARKVVAHGDRVVIQWDDDTTELLRPDSWIDATGDADVRALVAALNQTDGDTVEIVDIEMACRLRDRIIDARQADDSRPWQMTGPDRDWLVVRAWTHTNSPWLLGREMVRRWITDATTAVSVEQCLGRPMGDHAVVLTTTGGGAA